MQETPDDIVVFLTVTIFLTILMASFIIAILFVYRKKQMAYLEELERIKSDHEKSLLKTHLEIQEQTFQTISSEIHDNINLSLTLAKLHLNTLNLADTGRSTSQIQSSIEFISKAIIDLSDISRSMNSGVTESGLINTLEWEIEKLKKLGYFSIHFEITGCPVFMDAQRELFTFRIIQESFNNILKHAHARNISLHLHYTPAQVDITIADDGEGFDTSMIQSNKKRNGSSGLRNMQKRAQLLSGAFNVRSEPAKGTIVNISIPYTNGTEQD